MISRQIDECGLQCQGRSRTTPHKLLRWATQGNCRTGTKQSIRVFSLFVDYEPVRIVFDNCYPQPAINQFGNHSL
jgi:hypothetical protein